MREPPPPMRVVFEDEGWEIELYRGSQDPWKPEFPLLNAFERVRVEWPDAWRVLEEAGVKRVVPSEAHVLRTYASPFSEIELEVLSKIELLGRLCEECKVAFVDGDLVTYWRDVKLGKIFAYHEAHAPPRGGIP